MLKHPETVDIHNIVPVDARGNPDWAFPLHTHPHHVEISLVQEGGGTFYCEGRSYAMHPGDIIIKNAGLVHAEHTSREHQIRQICISLSGVNEITEKPNCLLAGFSTPVLTTGNDFEILSPIFSYLAAHWQEEDAASTCHHLLLAMLEIICRLIAEQRPEKKKTAQKERAVQVVTEVTEWINQNYSQKITLNMLAEKFFISPFYLEKRFKECTGYSINQYVVDRRMGEAQRMLIFDDLSIKEIALAVGYENLQYFYATFKKYTEKTPTAFRADFRSDVPYDI